MAVKTKGKAKKLTIPTDDNGNPDIYLLMSEHDMSVDEAAEAAGITGMKAWRLSLVQEVEHNPEERVPDRIKKNRSKLAAWVAKKRDDEKMRWEKLMARTGLSKTELMELYEESTGEPAKRLRGGKAEEDDEDEGKKKKGKAKPKGKGKGKTVVAEDDPEEDELDDDDDEDESDDDVDDDDEDDEDEEPVKPAAKAKRGRRK